MGKGSGNTRKQGPKIGSAAGATIAALGQLAAQAAQSGKMPSKGEKLLAMKSDIYSGLTDAEKKTIMQLENEYRKRKKESGAVINPDGTIFKQKDGSKTKISWYPDETAPDTVLTHNHPAYTGTLKGALERIGSPFSVEDLQFAVIRNLKEIRAVTEAGYVFSMKRPKAGWGVAPSAFVKESRSVRSKIRKAALAYGNAGKTPAERHTRYERLNVAIYHEVALHFAKKYGWKYTRKKL